MLFRPNLLMSAMLAGFLVLLIGASATPLRAQSGAVPARVTAHPSLSPVILVERPDAIQNFTADPPQVKQMIDGALLKLTSAPDIATAWTRLGITPRDVVGIKITTAGGPAMCTHHSLVRAISEGLQAAGVPAAQIIIWDKFQDKMRPAGYVLRAASGNHPAIASVVPGNNYDPDVFYRNNVAGSLMWGDSQFMRSMGYGGPDSGSAATRSYYTTFVTTACTKLINVPVLTDDRFVGMNGCLASLALGSVDNNRRFQGPPSYGDPAICEILNRDFIRRKVVVNILDALVAQCAGGPAFNPQFCQSPGALYVGRDPVAIDSLALPVLERMRRSMNVPPIGNTASYIQDACNYNLGTTDHRRIQLIRMR